MYRNERYFDKNEGKHNLFGQLDTDDNRNNKIKTASQEIQDVKTLPQKVEEPDS